jgi:hypothetical protein
VRGVEVGKAEVSGVWLTAKQQLMARVLELWRAGVGAKTAAGDEQVAVQGLM